MYTILFKFQLMIQCLTELVEVSSLKGLRQAQTDISFQNCI